MTNKEFDGKKLLILGGNAETVPLVRIAQDMGVKCIVASSVHDEPAKVIAWKASDVDGMDVPGLVELANNEKVDGVLVGVADMLVPSYCKVCEALDLPCYATDKIVNVFAFKDEFKTTCEQYGIHGIPEFTLDQELKDEDIDKIIFPVMVKPVDSASGQGIVKCSNKDDLLKAVPYALSFSKKKRFIVERFMDCDDMGMYYTFKDGECSASCIYDRYTTNEQPGLAKVCLGGTYPSKHLNEYFEKMHKNAVRMFKEIGIQNGVLMLSAFYENGDFYVYDTGFRLQGEAPHLLMKAIHGFDQREMLIRFALTGSEGDFNLLDVDDTYLRGKIAATLWFVLKQGTISKISGLDAWENDKCAVELIPRKTVGDTVIPEWIGTEKQVLARLYLVCDSKEELAERLHYYQNNVSVIDTNGNEMLLKGFDVEEALQI